MMLSERLLVSKIITGLGLALLLVVGAWSASHTETESGPASVVSATSAGDSLSHVAAAPFTTDSPAGPTWIDNASLLTGAAGCVFGVLCALLLIALIRDFVLRRKSRPATTSLRLRPPVVAALAAVFTPRFTLSQLSVSRT